MDRRLPGIAIVLTVLGLTLVGESINDLNDPRLRGRKRAGGKASRSKAKAGTDGKNTGALSAPESEAGKA